MFNEGDLSQVVGFLESMQAHPFGSEDMAEIDRFYREQIIVGVKNMRRWQGEEDLELAFSIVSVYGIQSLLDM